MDCSPSTQATDNAERSVMTERLTSPATTTVDAVVTTVPDEQLHTNSRRHRSSTPAVRQWTVKVVGVLLLRAVDLEFAARQSS